MTDQLSTPLAIRSQRRGFKAGAILPRRWPWARLTFGIVAAILGLATARIVLIDDPDGGRPSAEVAISNDRPQNAIAGQVAPPQAHEQATITPLDAEPASQGSGPQITEVGDLPADGPGAAGMDGPDGRGVLADLVEETQHGPIPRMGAQGETPFTAYARASVTPATANGQPLVAIVVTGLGLNESSSLDAVTSLPDDVTLAFAPYGRRLDRVVAAARAQGHEMFLQLPMEPFDYPDNDPGPETLLTGQPTRANLERLYWLMARFGGYAGVMNYMGARFTSSAADFTPMMEELGARGLGYLDDGSSNRSLAEQLSAANHVPFGRASVQIDINPAREPIKAALSQLEAKARETGSAIGVISALPVSLQTVAEWSKTLEDRGIRLVPASALMSKS